MEESFNTPLARYTTMKVGGEADRFCQPNSVQSLEAIVEELVNREEPWFVLGGGSNLLVSSSGFRGTVIRTTSLTKIKDQEPGVIEAEAGVRLPHLAKFAAAHGLSGLEFAVGIPGTVGGAVIMNAGAHGSCIANILQSATILDTESGKLTVLQRDDLEFTYRRCKLDPSKHVVVSARFLMEEGTPEAIEAKTKENEDYRWKTQPIGFPNSGSTFKNPMPDKTAGYLLDQSGAKELKVGDAAVSAIHANFVVNLGHATSGEITDVMKGMQDLVFNKFSIHLTPEWKTLGTFSASEKEIWGS